MGLLESLQRMINPQGAPGEDRGQWSDVPIGLRLGVLGDTLQGIASGRGSGNEGIAAIAAARQEAIGKRKDAKEKDKKDRLLEAYAKKVEMSNPDLAAQIRGGYIDPADIIKSDIQRERGREDFMWEQEQKVAAEERARQASPEYQMLTQLFPDIYKPGNATAAAGGQRAPAGNVTPPPAGTGGAPVTTAALPPDPGMSTPQPPGGATEAGGGPSRVGAFFGIPDLSAEEETRVKAAIAAAGGLSGGHAEITRIRSERAAAAEAQAKAAADQQAAEAKKVEGEQKLNKDQFDMAKDIRKEYTEAVKPLKTIESAAQRAEMLVMNPDMSPTDKISVLYDFIKTLDPMGSVREGDVALAQSAQSIFDRISQAYKSVAEGGTLSSEAANEIARTMASLGNQARQKMEAANIEYSSIADKSGVPRDRVFGDAGGKGLNPRKPIGVGLSKRGTGNAAVLEVPDDEDPDLKAYGGL